jgi:hypothetical protein
VGLDGSNVLLGLALRRLANLPRSCARRISLIETPLPNFNLLRGRADLAIFCFPNMIPVSLKETAKLKGHGLSKTDRMVARSLSLAGDPHNDEREAGDPRAIQHAMEQSRQISLNLRRLLADDGICMRVEYATVQRHELSPLELTQVSFEEGSLDIEVEGKMPRQWFRALASSYFRSRVLEDVYEQTADERDRYGGYLITVLRAI